MTGASTHVQHNLSYLSLSLFTKKMIGQLNASANRGVQPGPIKITFCHTQLNGLSLKWESLLSSKRDIYQSQLTYHITGHELKQKRSDK